MYKQLIGLTLLSIAAVSYAQVSGWIDCGSTTIVRAIIAGNCTNTPCPLARNNTYQIELHTTSAAAASSLPYTVTANILGLPWVIMEGNACDQTPCPVAAGEDFYLFYTYHVSDIFPPGMKWSPVPLSLKYGIILMFAIIASTSQSRLHRFFYTSCAYQ